MNPQVDGQGKTDSLEPGDWYPFDFIDFGHFPTKSLMTRNRMRVAIESGKGMKVLK